MKKSFINRMAVVLLAFLAGSTTASAQYNPYNPPEPSAKNTQYTVSVSTEPANAGYPSGAGSYKPGEMVYIYASPVYNYEFQYWKKVGSEGIYSESESFTYTMGEEDVSFVAVYAPKPYNPDSPSEPSSSNSYRLYFDCYPQGACSFGSTSGEKVEAGTEVYVYASPNQWYEFIPTFDQYLLVRQEMYFQYKMKAQSTTLVAKFKKNYQPSNPEEPASQQTDIDNPNNVKGDANGDRIVDIVDIVETVNAVNGKASGNFILSNADLNGNSKADLDDVKAISDLIMK